MRRKILTLVVLTAAILGGCSKGSQTASTTTTTTTAAEKSPANVAVVNGSTVYQTNCSSCHGADGKGSPGAFPPLAGNPFVTGDPARVIHVVKNGLTGPVKIGSQTYNGAMPAWAGTLKTEQIAAVVTFIRNSFGNKASVVTAGEVAAAK